MHLPTEISYADRSHSYLNINARPPVQVHEMQHGIDIVLADLVLNLVDPNDCRVSCGLPFADKVLLGVEVFVPGCSTAKEGFACDWKAFQNTVNHALAREFVEP